MAPHPEIMHSDLCATNSIRKKCLDCRMEYKARKFRESNLKKKEDKLLARGTGKYKDPQYVKILCEQCKYSTIKTLCEKCRKSRKAQIARLHRERRKSKGKTNDKSKSMCQVKKDGKNKVGSNGSVKNDIKKMKSAEHKVKSKGSVNNDINIEKIESSETSRTYSDKTLKNNRYIISGIIGKNEVKQQEVYADCLKNIPQEGQLYVIKEVIPNIKAQLGCMVIQEMKKGSPKSNETYKAMSSLAPVFKGQNPTSLMSGLDISRPKATG